MPDRRKKHFILIIALGIGLGLVLAFGAIKYTSRPQFCATCHEIAPYVARWEESVHKDTNCVKCHAEPGLIGTYKRKLYSVKELVSHVQGKEPSGATEVPNKNCLQCHDIEKLENSEKFNHSPHLAADSNLECLNCHRGVGHTPEKANLSLLGESEVCAKCHGGS